MGKRILACIVTLVMVASVPVQAFHEGIGGGEAPNRQPVARAGPDMVVGESQLILLDGSSSTDPDPDETEDLQFVWNVSQRPELAVFNPTTLQYERQPIELQVAQSCFLKNMGLAIKDPPKDPRFAYFAPYIPPGVPARLEMVFNLTVYDRDVDEVEALYPIPGQGNGTWATAAENETAYNAQQNHKQTDQVRVTVNNVNQPPHGYAQADFVLDRDEDGTNVTLCKQPKYLTLELANYVKGVHDQVGAVPDWDDDVDVDIWEDRGEYIQIRVRGFDDKEIRNVEVYLYHTDDLDAWEKQAGEDFMCQIDAVPERLRFGLGRTERRTSLWAFDPGAPFPAEPGSALDYPTQIYFGQTFAATEHLETWMGLLPVDTPQLVTGEYRVCARAFDGEGGSQIADPDEGRISVDESLDKSQSPACLSIFSANVDRAITPQVPFEYPTKEVITKFECTYDPPVCPEFPAQVLGAGNLLRLDVQVIPMGIPSEPEEYEPNTAFLLQKVIFQTELETAGGTVLGPETPLAAPYVIDLDTLALETTKIYVRAYDRKGGLQEMCVPVSPDVARPVVYSRLPENVYVGIETNWTYYLHDKLETISIQRIKGFDLADETRSTGADKDYVTQVRTTDPDVIVLPPLATFPKIDMNRDGYYDFVYDSRAVNMTSLLLPANADERIYDRFYDARANEVHVLSARRCDDDRYNDYFVDANNNRRCEPEELRLLGINASKANPHAVKPTALQKLGLEHDANLTAFLQDQRTYVLRHAVVPHPDQPYGRYHWVTSFEDEASNIVRLSGAVNFTRLKVDLSVKDLMYDSEDGKTPPLLPGATVPFKVTVARAEDPQTFEGVDKVDVEVAMAAGLDLGSPFEPWWAMDDFVLAADLYEAALDDGRIQRTQCGEVLCQLNNTSPVSVQFNKTLSSPGKHTMVFHAGATPFIEELKPENNQVSFTYQVYLGRADANGTEYYIKPGPRSQPVMEGGAIDLATGKTYDLRRGNGPPPQGAPEGTVGPDAYLFDVGGQTYYWNPIERHTAAGDECSLNNVVGDSLAPDCLPITKVRAYPPEDGGNPTPGPAVVMVLAALAAGVAIARRRHG